MPTYSALPWLHGARERAHGFLERRVGIEAVRIEDVDVVETHALQALVEAREQVFARAAALAVRARPHVPAGLAGDDQFVAVGREVAPSGAPKLVSALPYGGP
jgi:hypothetical protein